MEIWKMLNEDLKKWAGVTMEWNFPNGIKWKRKAHSGPYKDSGEVLYDHAYAYEGKERAQEIMGLINKIIKHPFALMKPGDPAYDRVVAPEVNASVRQLFEVSYFQNNLKCVDIGYGRHGSVLLAY